MARKPKAPGKNARKLDRRMEGPSIPGKWRFKVIDDTGIRFTAVRRSVSQGMASAARGAGLSQITLLEAVSAVIRDALRGAFPAGGDSMMEAKAIVMGVLGGAGVRKSAALKVLEQTTRAVIRQTAGRNGDVGSVVTGLVRGAIAGAPLASVSTANAALAVVEVAIEEVYRIGSIEAPQFLSDLRRQSVGL